MSDNSLDTSSSWQEQNPGTGPLLIATPPGATTPSSISSDDVLNNYQQDAHSLYEANIARQLLALKDGVPAAGADVIQSRRQRKFIEEQRKDEAYWERRRKNNEAAKRSREKRRMNDMAMDTQVGSLYKEIDRLRDELIIIKRSYDLPIDQPFTQPDLLSISSHVKRRNQQSSPSLQIVPNLPLLLKQHHHLLNQPMMQMPKHKDSELPNISTDGHRSVPVALIPAHYPLKSPSLPNNGGNKIKKEIVSENWHINDMTTPERKPKQQSHFNSSYPPVTNPLPVVEEDRSKKDEVGSKHKEDIVEQVAPLNLVKVEIKQEKESYDDMSARLFKEACRRFEEIKAGSVETISQRDLLAHARDSGLVSSENCSTTSSDGGSPKRIRLEGCDKVREDDVPSVINECNDKLMMKQCIDPKYAERRRRNNDASRRSRENRKQEVKLQEEKSNVLENENSKLREELNNLSSEVSELRQMIVSRHGETIIDVDSPNQKNHEIIAD